MRTADYTPPAQDIIDTEAAWMDALAAVGRIVGASAYI